MFCKLGSIAHRVADFGPSALVFSDFGPSAWGLGFRAGGLGFSFQSRGFSMFFMLWDSLDGSVLLHHMMKSSPSESYCPKP